MFTVERRVRIQQLPNGYQVEVFEDGNCIDFQTISNVISINRARMDRQTRGQSAVRQAVTRMIGAHGYHDRVMWKDIETYGYVEIKFEARVSSQPESQRCGAW
jgi:hypothetical protein